MRAYVYATAIVLAAISTACSGDIQATAATQAASATPKLHSFYVLVIDRSTSVTAAELDGYHHLADQVIDEMSFGDRLTMIVAYAAGRKDGTELVTREMPSARNPASPLPTEQNALVAARKSL